MDLSAAGQDATLRVRTSAEFVSMVSLSASEVRPVVQPSQRRWVKQQKNEV